MFRGEGRQRSRQTFKQFTVMRIVPLLPLTTDHTLIQTLKISQRVNSPINHQYVSIATSISERQHRRY